VNEPKVRAEVRKAFERYEAALRSHDVEALNGFFWDSASAVRFGLAEQGYGARSIRAQRRGAKPIPPGRRLRHTVIATFGEDAASVCTEFTSRGSSLVGRQSQVWIRMGGLWRIVAAHVSIVRGTQPLPARRG